MKSTLPPSLDFIDSDLSFSVETVKFKATRTFIAKDCIETFWTITQFFVTNNTHQYIQVSRERILSRSFSATQLEGWILTGIEAAFDEWLEMSGEWLKTAPEYMLTVKVAQTLKASIPAKKRTLLMEPHVAKTLADAGGIQRGPNAAKLRSGGRYDIVIGYGNGWPRAVIELKNPLWTPLGKAAVNDLHRICRSLLQGKSHTTLYTGALAFYTSAAMPLRKDDSATERLERRCLKDWDPKLKSWEWAGSSRKRYQNHLKISIQSRIHELQVGKEMHAWAAVCIQITRKPRRPQKRKDT